MRVTVRHSTPVVESARVKQLEGMFEVPPTKVSEVAWDHDLPIEDRHWNVGLVVGPSGCGKSTLVREAFPDALVAGYDWPPDRSIIDAFPKTLGIKEITAILSSVGFSSPPAWLRPFHVLSNGEQFRVTMARAIAEGAALTVLDEFTSVVDRTVAKIGSAAIAKTVRKRDMRFIAVACHYDIIEWLQPDWTYEPATGTFSWRSVQPRPRVTLTIQRVHHSAWKLFRHHHYLDTSLNKAATCFLATVDGMPAAFCAVLPFPHGHRSGWRLHRTVCLPDFQGVGIGNRLNEFVSSMFRATGKPVFSTTGHPAMIHYRARSPVWKLLRKPGQTSRKQGPHTKIKGLNRTAAKNRLTAGFEYVGPVREEDARRFGLKFHAGKA